MKKQFKAFSTGLVVICLSANVVAQTSSVQPPPLPNFASCNGRPDEASCRQYLENQYQQNLNIYNTALAAERKAQEEYRAKQAAEVSQDQNIDAKKAYNKSSAITKIISIAAAAAYAASGGTNTAALALSIMMAMYSNKAKQQAQSHNVAQYNSCNLANQISTSQANCGSPPGDFTPAGYPNNGTPDLPDLVDTGGRCIASAEICDQINRGLPPGTDLRDYRNGLQGFASGKAPYKVNPDGSITSLKNGRTYTLGDFKDASSMAAAGMKPGDIAMVGNMFKGGTGTGLDAKKDLNALAGGGGGELEDAAARAAAAAAAAAAAQELDTNGLGKKDRTLASAEGLAKDFNGELIGVAGDNIWKMMNRRYKLKTAQDSFMNTAKP